jgi:hypothetical protein
MKRGLEMMGMEAHSHQLELGTLFDERNSLTAVCWPRRAGKTTSVWAWILGMCDLVPYFTVIVTAQTGSMSSDRLMDHGRFLERYYPEENGGPRIKRGSLKSIEFQNGSRILSVAPKGDSFRGSAANVIVFDEAQSYHPELSEDLNQGASPLLDTVEDGMIILAGTPGNNRAGWFWDSLEMGRKGTLGIAISEHAAKEHDDADDPEVWQRVHPGIGTLTTLKRMHEQHDKLSAPQWSQEYLGIWPPDSITSALPDHLWKATEKPAVGLPESTYVFGFDCHPEGTSASISAGWFDAEGTPHIQVMEHRAGTAWLEVELSKMMQAHPRAFVVYDNIGFNVTVAQNLSRNKKIRVAKLKMFSMKDMAGAAALISQTLSDKALVHHTSNALDHAAAGVTWRWSGSGSRLFGRKSRGGNYSDITPLVAASSALFHAAGLKKKTAFEIPKPILGN